MKTVLQELKKTVITFMCTNLYRLQLLNEIIHKFKMLQAVEMYQCKYFIQYGDGKDSALSLTLCEYSQI